MSLLNKASLIQIPSGYKDGTLYSAKPTNGDGDFTFSRGSNLAATRVNSEGLIEKGRENILTYSNDFSQSIWQKLNNAVVSGQTATDPFGNINSAWDVVFDGTTSCRIEQSISGVINGGVYASSIWARTKSGTQDVSFGSVFTENFTLTTEWQRISLFEVENDTVAYVRLACNDAVTIEVYAAQLEQGLVATDYIETTTTTAQAGILEDMPRLDYSGGASCGHLLLEPQRSNLVTSSEYIHGWLNAGGTSSQNSEDSISPQGLYNSAVLDASSVRFQTFSISSSAYSYSVYAKAKSGSILGMRIDTPTTKTTNFNLTDGTIQSTGSGHTASIESVGNGWYRCIISFTDSIVNAVLRTTSSGSVYVWGAQLEEGSYPTSYIPTYGGSSVTRSHDVCKITGADATDIINQPAMTLFVEAQLDDNGATTILSILRDLTGGLYNDFIALTYINSLKVNFEVRENASPQATIQSGVLSEGVHKIAAVLTSTSMKLFIDGSLENSATITAIPDDLDEIYLAGYPDTTARFGTKKQFLFFPTALSDDECEQLTTL